MKEVTHQVSFPFTVCISKNGPGSLPNATYWEELGTAAGNC